MLAGGCGGRQTDGEVTGTSDDAQEAQVLRKLNLISSEQQIGRLLDRKWSLEQCNNDERYEEEETEVMELHFNLSLECDLSWVVQILYYSRGRKGRRR